MRWEYGTPSSTGLDKIHIIILFFGTFPQQDSQHQLVFLQLKRFFWKRTTFCRMFYEGTVIRIFIDVGEKEEKSAFRCIEVERARKAILQPCCSLSQNIQLQCNNWLFFVTKSGKTKYYCKLNQQYIYKRSKKCDDETRKPD